LSVLYTVTSSDEVKTHLRKLGYISLERGDDEAFFLSLREFEKRLRIYPQFGDPLADLRGETGTIRVGIIRPISMRYAIFEERRLVVIAPLPVLMPM
jgi:hypothetical protein